MDLKEGVESEEEDAGGDGDVGESGSSSSSMNQYIANIKEEEEEKDSGFLSGMDPLLLSAWAGDEVPVFDQGQLDLMFFQGPSDRGGGEEGGRIDVSESAKKRITRDTL